MMEGFFRGLEGPSYRVFTLHAAPGDAAEAVESGPFLIEIRRWAVRFSARPERVVAIFGRMTTSLIAAWFGAILAGRLPVFLSHPSRKIPPADFARRLANYAGRFEGCLFVGLEQERALCPGLLSPGEPDHDFLPDSLPFPCFSPDSPLFLQCSSGTTGLQKAVAITAGMLTAQLRAHARAIGLDPARDRLVSWLPLYHDMGLAGVLLPALLTRTPLHLLETFEWAANPAWLLEVIARERGTLCWLPNFAFSLLARVGGRYDLASMRAFINCSEPVTAGAFGRFMAAFGVDGGRLAVCYALAENVFAATHTPLGSPPRAVVVERMALARRQVRLLAAWRVGERAVEPDGEGTVLFGCGGVVPGVSLRIESRSGEETVGEILLSGPCAVAGYLGQPPLREDGWLPTGDLGFLLDGELFVSGRIKELIIHNGKNIHPVDVEETVGRHALVQPGRVTAMGRVDEEVDSERVLVLFEPARPLSVAESRDLCQGLRGELDALFDIRSEVDCVPRNWLRKTSSGKMARQENLQRYLAALRTGVHLAGDSHVRIFWSGPTTHHNRYRRIHAHWLGLLWSQNWRQTSGFFARLLPRLGPTDVLILQFGEPECRAVFPVAADPEAAIREAVAEYRAFFLTLRRIWPGGRLAYLTGIPTHPLDIDNGDPAWPVRGTPEARYRWQKLFYRAMHTVCSEVAVHFLDLCTPLLGADGFLDPGLLCDRAHLDPAHEEVILRLLREHFGHLDLAPNVPDLLSSDWDGSREHFQELMRRKIREINPLIEEGEWDRLVSGGVLDSLGIVELVAVLDRTFGFAVRPETMRRGDFESIAGIWARFGPGGSARD